MIAARCGDFSLDGQSLGIAGALAGFLFFNQSPASIFMGDCGALPLGFLLGALALRVSADTSRSSPILYAIPLLIMLARLLDMTTVTLSRVSRDTPITRRGLDHSYHKLLSLGFSEPLAVRICWAVAALVGASAVLLAQIDPMAATLLLPSVAAAFAILALFVLDLKGDAPPGSAMKSSGLLREVHYQVAGRTIWRELAAVGLDALLITGAYSDAFLIRLGPAVGNGRMIAIVTNIPTVVLASYISFLSFGLYRRVSSGFDLARLASAAAGAGILILLASYFLPLMVSGVVALIFVAILFGFLVATRLSFETVQRIIVQLARTPHRIVEHFSTSYAQTAMVAALLQKENLPLEENKRSK